MELEMDNEQAASLLGRALAQGTAIELLLALYLADKPDEVRLAVFATLRSASNNPGPPGAYGDAAAVFMSDARVHAMQATEHLLERTAAQLKGLGRSI